MRKYQKMGCVRYAANDAKAAELESMGYTECTCAKSTQGYGKKKVNTKSESSKKSGKKVDPEIEPEAPVVDSHAPDGGDDDGSDPTDNK